MQVASSSGNQISTSIQAKIEKFANMLKTLNGYKSQYKEASSNSEKKQIHNKVADFTQKWLDAKNL